MNVVTKMIIAYYYCYTALLLLPEDYPIQCDSQQALLYFIVTLGILVAKYRRYLLVLTVVIHLPLIPH